MNGKTEGFVMASKQYRMFLMVVIFFMSSLALTAFGDQEEVYHLADEDIFGKLRRPSVVFPHEIHADILSDDDCITCHHDQDENTGKLIYQEGEEQPCKECHGNHAEGSKPALREAFHGSCTFCHRNMIKKKGRNKGPTTCGGCHKR